ncbi:HpcH/HpaI aldolase/citrate lyase family protein [Pseudonocardia sp. CA-107938]|uniref:HpcH/HpaI aldolase/citrate lyase family protein n=1 Tax=Pseudonocardia sp. CA-107938 TaxID=3240021 RepID=UPI003D8D2BEB
MRHFSHLAGPAEESLFESPPEEFHRDSPSRFLAVALGATLYMPADRPSLPADITKQAAAGVTSVVVCLEDAIADEQVATAEDNLVATLRGFADLGAELPLVFVRVRDHTQIRGLVKRLGTATAVVDGFVLPKFTATSGVDYLHAVDRADRAVDRMFHVMPVVESGAALYAETRVDELTRMRAVLHRDRERVLAVRIGATDLCAYFGLRRSPDVSIYDIKVVADLIADVVNVFGRVDGSGFAVSGPVWEYFTDIERIFKPQLRSTPFSEHNVPELRGQLLSRALDGLIREVQLDRANGLTGKTTIHPSHVAVVNALQVVPLEEYRDAMDVLGAGRASGVMASGLGNKMNEIRPHMAWARATADRARVFGVSREGISFVDLLAAGMRR